MGVAYAFFGLRANTTVILVRSDDDEVALLNAKSFRRRWVRAGFCASSPCIPFPYTVDWARASVAVSCIFKSRTNDSAAFGGCRHHALAGLNTTVAFLTAFVPRVPGGNLAVYRAAECVATRDVAKSQALFATIAMGADDRFGTSLATTRASLRAPTPAGPIRRYAVNGARLKVAHTGFLVGACITTMFGSNIDVVGTSLYPFTTCLRARGPVVPGVLTVDSARVGVAVLFRVQGWAGSAAAHVRLVDKSGALSDAAAAFFVTGSPPAPFRNVAIDRTTLGFTRSAF